MTMALLMLIVSMILVVTIAQNDVDIEPTDNMYAKCIRDNKSGYCVSDIQCLPNGTIAKGGVVIDSDIRDSSPPLLHCGNDLWCCWEDASPVISPTPVPPPPTPRLESGACARVYDDMCIWCVALYRSGGVVSLGQRSESGLYCSGALVGRRVVITAATCVRTVGSESIKARLPASDNPAKDYAVVDRIQHPDYNTGSHANDFGLMVLSEDALVEYDSACIDFKTPPGDNCQVIGFSARDELVLTPVNVRDRNCKNKRSSNEVACGEARDAQCEAATGAPLLCRTSRDEQGGLVVAGVARQHCRQGKVLLGKVQPHYEWLSNQLMRLGVEPRLYNV